MMKKRLLSATLAGLLTLSLAGCGEADVQPTTAPPSEPPKAEVSLAELGISEDMVYDAVGIAAQEPVLTVGGADVTAEMVFYWMMAMGDQYAQGGMSDWDMEIDETTTLGSYLKDLAVDMATYQKAMELQAEADGVGLSDENKADYADRIATILESMDGETEGKGDSVMAYWRAYMGLSPAGFEAVNLGGYYNQNLEALYLGEGGLEEVTDADVVAMIDDYGMVNAKHILVMAEADEDTGDDGMAAALEEANKIRAELKTAGDTEEAFDAAMVTYTADVDMAGAPNNPDGYTYDATGMLVDGSSGLVKPFVEAGEALEIGEVSEPVASDYGYHILLRTEVDHDIVMETCRNAKLGELTQAWVGAYEVEALDALAELDFAEAYEAFAPVRATYAEKMEALYPEVPAE